MRKKVHLKIFLICVILLFWHSCKPYTAYKMPKMPQRKWRNYCKYVRYEVSGSSRVSVITIHTDLGRTAQFRNIALASGARWVKEYDWFNSDFVYLSAVNGSNSGSVRVAIYVLQDAKYIPGRGCQAGKSKARLREWAASRKRARAYGTYPTKKGGFE